MNQTNDESPFVGANGEPIGEALRSQAFRGDAVVELELVIEDESGAKVTITHQSGRKEESTVEDPEEARQMARAQGLHVDEYHATSERWTV